MVRKYGCLSSLPPILETGVLSSAARVGMAIAPSRCTSELSWTKPFAVFPTNTTHDFDRAKDKIADNGLYDIRHTNQSYQIRRFVILGPWLRYLSRFHANSWLCMLVKLAH
ncbi:hypothetical protein BDN67DRAFT_965655 [Paxillus ammoniavirescens]|nr:hypothetical protein BDN67DRAFT_965655 [Paxillus ammoniavirescens]